MNRFKKELRKKGIKLECDYPYLPFEEGGLTIDTVRVNTETATVSIFSVSIDFQMRITKSGMIQLLSDEEEVF